MVQQLERPVGDDVQALKATLDRLVHNVGTLLNVPSVSVALLELETGDLVTWSALGTGPSGPRHTRFRTNEGIAGWVASHLEPVIVNDVTHDPRFKPLGSARIGSMLCVPLIDHDQDQLLGTLTVTSPSPNAFDARRQNLLQIFSDQAVLAIAKTRQAEAAKAQARELTALLDASRALTSTLDLDHVFAYIVASIRKVIACDDAVIYAYDEHADVLLVVTGFGARMERLGGARVSLEDDRSIAAWVAKHRRARVSVPGGNDIGTLTGEFLAGGDAALLCVPLVSKARLRGVIMLAREEPFLPSELSAMLNLSNIVAATLENTKLYQTARAEREQQAAIYAAASDAIAVIDSDLRLIEANDAFARLARQTPSQVLGRLCCEVLQTHQESDCPFCEPQGTLAEALRTGEAVAQIECELTNTAYTHERVGDEGDVNSQKLDKRYVDFSVTPVMSPLGRRLLLVGRDVTVAREMEQMKANFLSMVSHELRAPLQTINGYLDVMINGIAGKLSTQQAEFARRARAGSERLTSQVDDLLLVSRRDAGRFTLNLADVDLAPLLTETVQDLEVVAEEASVSLISEVPLSLPLVRADGPRIAQVMRNLVTNAVKFTPSGGYVQVAAEVAKDHLLLRVRDTGIGIASEHQERIFDRFYQVTGSTPHSRSQGQGLGLAIVRIIVEGHGGRVDVQSMPHQGSTFTIYLPRAHAHTYGPSRPSIPN